MSAGFWENRIHILRGAPKCNVSIRSKHSRKARNHPNFVADHLRSDYDMTKQLSIVRVIVLWEKGNFFCLADIMTHRGSQSRSLFNIG